MVMKHPPEKAGYKPLAGSYDWIDAQVRRERTIPTDHTYQLISDDQTEQEYKQSQLGGDPASYQLVTFDAEGTARYSRYTPRIYFKPTELDLQEDEKAWRRNDMELELSRATARRDEAVKYFTSRGEPVPDEFNEDVNRLQQNYDANAPRKVPSMSNEPPLETSVGGAL